MKSFISFLSILVFISAGVAQQPSARRPGLDQMDLISVRPTQQAVRKDENTIKIDKNVYKTLFGPIVLYSQKTESDYLSFLDTMRSDNDESEKPVAPKTSVDYSKAYKKLRDQTLAIYRSITIIGSQMPANPSALAVLKANQETVAEMQETLFLMSGGDNAPYRGRLREIAEKYSAAPFEGMQAGELIASKQAIISAMLSTINKNFARFRYDD